MPQLSIKSRQPRTHGPSRRPVLIAIAGIVFSALLCTAWLLRGDGLLEHLPLTSVLAGALCAAGVILVGLAKKRSDAGEIIIDCELGEEKSEISKASSASPSAASHSDRAPTPSGSNLPPLSQEQIKALEALGVSPSEIPGHELFNLKYGNSYNEPGQVPISPPPSLPPSPPASPPASPSVSPPSSTSVSPLPSFSPGPSSGPRLPPLSEEQIKALLDLGVPPSQIPGIKEYYSRKSGESGSDGGIGGSRNNCGGGPQLSSDEQGQLEHMLQLARNGQLPQESLAAFQRMVARQQQGQNPVVGYVRQTVTAFEELSLDAPPSQPTESVVYIQRISNATESDRLDAATRKIEEMKQLLQQTRPHLTRIDGISEREKLEIRTLVPEVVQMIDKVMGLLPLFVAVGGQEEAVRRLLLMIAMFREQMDGLPRSEFVLTLEDMQKLQREMRSVFDFIRQSAPAQTPAS